MISRPNIIRMSRVVISEDARSADLAALALAFNEVVQLPVTMRSARFPGVRVERGTVLDDEYSGPVLEEVIATGKSIRTTPKDGAYQGIPVSVAPILVEGRAVAAVGIVDVIGTIDIPEVFGAYEAVIKQVSGKVPVKR
ncbi:MAG: hypothetical protein A4E49_02582 [Methanosaeta sp. PtaU1.Bin112]|nr:MAG: hypothetical protein A4E49_02582 [Methanosaeta sp. PtaU1.Bin112]